MAGSSSSNTTARSAHILRLQFKESKASLQLSFLNNSTLVGDSEEVKVVLWALVFLGMVLGKGPTHREKKIKTKGRLQVSTKTEYRIKIYMMHEQVK